ncbi:MAG: hypothetical protein NT000_01815 [Proteobacteria bacterium]|nr:hypothetical protein [Pseudomonadota bacterium]
MNDFEYKTEYRYVLTNKDCEKIERLIALLSDAIYELFRARELVDDLVIDESPSAEECHYHEELHKLKTSMDEMF